MTCWIKTDSQSMALSSLRSWLSILVPFCLISQIFIRAVAFVTDELFLLYSTPEISVSIWSMGLSLKNIEKYFYLFHQMQTTNPESMNPKCQKMFFKNCNIKRKTQILLNLQLFGNVNKQSQDMLIQD